MVNKLKIEGLLKDNPQGLTIQELVDRTNLAWNTVTKNLAMIEGEKNISIRQVGKAKLHYWIFEKGKKGGKKKK